MAAVAVLALMMRGLMAPGCATECRQIARAGVARFAANRLVPAGKCKIRRLIAAPLPIADHSRGVA